MKLKAFKKTIEVPGDKSISHRSIILSSLAKGKTKITNLLKAEDVLHTVEIFKQLGATIRFNGNITTVNGIGLKHLHEPEQILNVGNSGTGLRLITGILAGQTFNSFLTGDQSIVKRPMKRIITPLSKMGALIYGKDQNSKAPLCVVGNSKLKAITYKMPVASAQVKSALLLAGLFVRGQTRIIEPMPSRDHTERMFEYFGLPIKREENVITFNGPASEFEGKSIFVPGDISSANYFIILTLLKKNSTLHIKNVGLNPTRTGLLDVLKSINANIKIKNVKMKNNESLGDLECSYSPDMQPFVIEKEMVPNVIDDIPILAILASQINGESSFYDVNELRYKESDRIKAIVSNLKKIGVKAYETNRGFVVKGGGGKLKPAQIKSFHDHRIVMSFYIAEMVLGLGLTFDSTESVKTSFPDFFQILRGLNE